MNKLLMIAGAFVAFSAANGLVAYLLMGLISPDYRAWGFLPWAAISVAGIIALSILAADPCFQGWVDGTGNRVYQAR